MKEFETLIGKWFGFYGVCDTCFKLGRDVFEAIEDPDDGYRSHLDTIKAVKIDNLTFSRIPFARVQVVDATTHCFDGYVLKDESGHVWLTVGTENTNDYYPCFSFHYSPKSA